MFVRKLPHYYCIVVTFSQTPKFIRSLHSFLDRKHSDAHSPLYMYSLSVAVTPTLDFPPKPHIIITEISRPPHPIRAQSFTTASGTKPGPPWEEETWSRRQCEGRQQVESAMWQEGKRFCTIANKARGWSNV